MRVILIISLLLFSSLFAKRGCYSIKTEVGLFTPVYPNEIFSIKTCKLKELPLTFDEDGYYIGCYKTKKEAINRYRFLKKSGFRFKNEKILKIYPTQYTPFVIFPYFAKSTQKKLAQYKKEFLERLETLTPTRLEKRIPKNFYGDGIELKDIDAVSLLPIPNIFAFYRYYTKHHLSKKMIVLYNGIYSIKDIHKKFPYLVRKIAPKTYLLKAPLYIAKTASLVIQNKKILLETEPKPIFIMYHGNLFIDNSSITTYSDITKGFAKREYIKEEEILLVGKQKPRPYFLGLSNSNTLFLNSSFRGLGFHDSVSTFGIALAQLPTSILHVSNILNFLRLEKPQGTYVGNEIYDSMMGFYSANAKNIDIVGNYIHHNIIYDVDPHDFSTNLIIARNLLSDAHHAHGVVISRGVNKTFIAQNIAIHNHSDGIMLDRKCPDNIIYDNLSFANGYMGISFQETDNNSIENNYVAYNIIDGIIIRNSLNTLIKNNHIIKNGRNGIEVLVKNIDDTVYRDFARDPYHKAASCVVIDNTIRNNINNQITVKNRAAIKMYRNHFDKNDINLFGENLTPFIEKIIKNNFNFKLYGIGNRFHPIPTDELKIQESFYDIFAELSLYNSHSGLVLAEIYRLLDLYSLMIQELKREASNLIARALEAYAFYKLAQKDITKKQILTYVSYIIESAIMGDKDAFLSISELKYVLPISTNDLQSAYMQAKKRMQRGEIFSKEDKKDSIVCHFPLFPKKVVRAYIERFDYQYRHSKLHNIISFFNEINKNFSLMPPNIFQKMQEIYREKNLPKIRYIHYLKQKKIMLERGLLCRRYVQKNSYTLAESKKVLADDLQENIYKYKPLFERYLHLINKHRKKKIGFDEIVKILHIKGTR